jgi:hypothetical protein
MVVDPVFEVVIESEAFVASVNDALNRIALKSFVLVLRTLQGSVLYRISLEGSFSNLLLLSEAIGSIPGVLDVCPDLEISLNTAPVISNDSASVHSLSNRGMPPSFRWNHSSAGFDRIDLSAYTEALRQIVICQLDTGFTHHPEIASIRKKDGLNFVESNTAAEDPLNVGPALHPGHGTSVAAMIIGHSTHAQLDFNDGVLPCVGLVPFRISSSVVHLAQNTIPSAIAVALEYGYPIISMSMGGGPPRMSWYLAAREAYERGVIWVCAAGNNTPFVVWPAAWTETIAAAACDWNDAPWKGSSHGASVDISAPGHQVFVPYVDGNAYDYRFSSGTSFATPHVAAAAALWQAHHGKRLDPYRGSWRMVEAFRDVLKRSARVPSDWNIEENGAGILDVVELLRAPLASPTELVKAPSSFELEYQTKLTCLN